VIKTFNNTAVCHFEHHMSMWSRSIARITCLHRIHMRCSKWMSLMACVISILCCSTSIFAQQTDLDTGLLIERLRQQQQIQQLNSLANTEDVSDDILKRYASLCSQLLNARSQSDSTLIKAISTAMRTLSADHPCAPLWVMLSSEVQLYDLWATQKIDPTLIVSLGYPTEAQQQEIQIHARAFEPKLSDAYQQLKNYPTGIKTLMQQRCGFLLAQMRYLLAITDINTNQNQLLKQAHEVLLPLLNTTRDDWKMIHRARWLDVSILLAMGQTDTARQAQPAIETDAQSMLITAKTLAAMGDTEGAYKLLSKLESEAVPNDPTMQLAIADSQHQLLFPKQDYQRAFGMYIRLLENNPSQNLKNAIASRWQMKQVIGPTLKNLPDNVLFAIANQMFDIAQHGDDPTHSALTLTASSLILLRDRQSVIESPMHERVQLLWAILKPTYEPGDPQKVIESLSMLTHLAENSNNEKLVYDAIKAGIQLTGQLLKSPDRALKARALSAYLPLARILYTRFNTSELADDYRLFDVVAVRLPAKEYALALQRLSNLPASHGQYWLAQRYQLGIYRQLIVHPDWPAARIIAAVAPIRDQAVNQLAHANTKQNDIIQHVALESSGMLWQLAAKQNQWLDAANQLQWIETDTSLKAADRQAWLCRRLISLQRGKQFKSTGKLAKQLLDEFGKPVFSVVMQALTAMDEQLDSQRRSQMLDPKLPLDQTQHQALLSLSQSVVKWASSHIADEHQLLLAKIVWAKSLTDAGQMRDALTLLSPLAQQFESEPDLWLALGECHYRLELGANYQQAAKLFHQLIGRSLPDAQGKFPIRYWHAWTRYLQICDLTNQHTHVIVSRIASLKAEDPTLGGEPYASLLRALNAKYSQHATDSN